MYNSDVDAKRDTDACGLGLGQFESAFETQPQIIKREEDQLALFTQELVDD